jgi:uncharacterized protein (TIGR02266 family)
MQCTACRSELPDGSQFCGVCGFRLEQAPAYPVVSTASRGPDAPGAPTHARRIDAHVPPAAQAAAAAELRTLPEEAPALLTRRTGQTAAVSAGASTRAHGDNAPGLGPAPARHVAPAPVAAPAPAHPAHRPTAEHLVLRPSTEQRTKTIEIKRVTADAAAAALAAEAQRRQDRFALAVEVTLASEHNFYQGFVENISAGGVFVATNDIHAVGTQFDLTFSLPELNRTCTALCEVRWVRDYNTSPDLAPGMGLAFLRIAPADQKAVEVFLRHREPIFFDDEAV